MRWGCIVKPNVICGADDWVAIERFGKAKVTWVRTLAAVMPGDVVAIDGKTLRQTFDTATGKAAIHRVSAWASAQAIENGLHCVLDVTMNQGPRASRRPTAELDGIQ